MSDLNLTSDQSGINVGSYSNPFNPPAVPVGPITPPAAISEFQYISQYSMQQVGILVNIIGELTDVGNVTMSMFPLPMPGTSLPANQLPSVAIFSATAIEPTPGVYEVPLTAASTSVPGYYRADWSFTYQAVTQTISTYLQVGVVSPAYDNLPFVMKQIVEAVWLKLADGYDSPVGGPNVQMWYQTHFNRGRVAQLLIQAIQHLNNAAQPVGFYSADGVTGPIFPTNQWSGLLNTALTVEVTKHLMRAYVEDPDIQGAVQARMIRRDYLARWGSMLTIEQQDLHDQLQVFKISQMFLCQPRVLVAGGIYPRWGRNPALIGAFAARGMYRNFWF